MTSITTFTNKASSRWIRVGMYVKNIFCFHILHILLGFVHIFLRSGIPKCGLVGWVPICYNVIFSHVSSVSSMLRTWPRTSGRLFKWPVSARWATVMCVLPLLGREPLAMSFGDYSRILRYAPTRSHLQQNLPSLYQLFTGYKDFFELSDITSVSDYGIILIQLKEKLSLLPSIPNNFFISILQFWFV